MKIFGFFSDFFCFKIFANAICEDCWLQAKRLKNFGTCTEQSGVKLQEKSDKTKFSTNFIQFILHDITFLLFTTLSGCTPFSVRLLFRQRSRRMTHNGMAAWRSGGFYAPPFKSALPAAVAPNRSLSAGIFTPFFASIFSTKFFPFFYRLKNFDCY
jgi:hypothetical protein